MDELTIGKAIDERIFSYLHMTYGLEKDEAIEYMKINPGRFKREVHDGNIDYLDGETLIFTIVTKVIFIDESKLNTKREE